VFRKSERKRNLNNLSNDTSKGKGIKCLWFVVVIYEILFSHFFLLRI